MTLFVLAYLAGLLTIASPCIVPVLPFVLARADRPFRRSGLPMLLGLALAFAAAASLAAAGGWAVGANRLARLLALAALALFGAGLVWPGLAARLAAPLVSLGSRLARRADGVADGSGRPADVTWAAPVLLGVATGLLWTPCAGPVLGLILTGAALRGPSLETSSLLLTYGLGAATALGAGLTFGGRLLASLRTTARWSEGVRRGLGVAVLAGVAAFASGVGENLLAGLPPAPVAAAEAGLIAALRAPRPAPAAASGPAPVAAPPVAPAPASASAPAPILAPALPAPLRSVLRSPQWLNTPGLHEEDLRGKVVLVAFWTYSCINCLRTLPHVRAWAAQYRDRGLVVIGVHTPEFAFERDAGNVGRATAALGIGYPVAIDSDFRIWRDFGNDAWPSFYVFGADGRLRHRTEGEGDYARTEAVIRHLLAEAGMTAPAPAPAAAPARASPDASPAAVLAGPQAAPDEADLRSPETYLGYAKAERFASPGAIAEDVARSYRSPPTLPLNAWGLSGLWTVGPEFATLERPSGRIALRFHARDAHLVLAPAADGRPVRFRVTVGGAPPGADHGSDADAQGLGTVRDARLYQLVRQSGTIADRTVEIEFLDPGVRAYAFTFG